MNNYIFIKNQTGSKRLVCSEGRLAGITPFLLKHPDFTMPFVRAQWSSGRLHCDIVFVTGRTFLSTAQNFWESCTYLERFQEVINTYAKQAPTESFELQTNWTGNSSFHCRQRIVSRVLPSSNEPVFRSVWSVSGLIPSYSLGNANVAKTSAILITILTLGAIPGIDLL